VKVKTVALAVACFGTGLLTGHVIFHGTTAVQHRSAVVAADVSERQTNAPSRKGGVSLKSRSEPTNALSAAVPASKDRDVLYQALAFQWANIDLTAANKWVDNLPAGQLRDQVVRPIAEQMSTSDPAAAARLLDTIQNNDLAWQLAAPQIANRWFKIDPDAAKAWVAQSSLPEVFKENFANQKP